VKIYLNLSLYCEKKQVRKVLLDPEGTRLPTLLCHYGKPRLCVNIHHCAPPVGCSGVLSIEFRRISIRRIPIIGLGLGLGIGFGELKFGELKRNRVQHATEVLVKVQCRVSDR